VYRSRGIGSYTSISHDWSRESNGLILQVVFAYDDDLLAEQSIDCSLKASQLASVFSSLGLLGVDAVESAIE